MHKLILETELVDHKDGNGLNNQKENLRECTRQQNNWNTSSKSKSGYKGVYYFKNGWVVLVRMASKTKYFGRYKTAEEAALIYNKIVQELHGEFAHFNEIPCAN